VGYTIADATQLQASNYLVMRDPAVAGNYLVTRQSDNTTVSVASGATVDGFTLNVNAAALPAAGDQFILRPVAAAALNMKCVLDDPKGVAAACPVTASVGANNTGTASVSSLVSVGAPVAPNLTASISFTDNLGHYTWQLADSTGTVVQSSAPLPAAQPQWTAGQSINLDGWQLNLNGVPLSGDTITVAPTLFPATNNGNARTIADFRDAAIVGVQGGSGGATITDAYANAMTDVGVRVNGAKASADMSASIAQSAQETLSNKTGVNLDEEAAKLMQYQQSYQAAAKVLQVAQKVFDSLLAAAGAA
jgi:flagellar hook-associated protein 1 FlgK